MEAEVFQVGIAGLKEIKNTPKQKEDPAIVELKAEAERLFETLSMTSDLILSLEEGP
ncbi:MAG: hypothetical protein ACXVCE_13265 [Bacteriovorax sp.]